MQIDQASLGLNREYLVKGLDEKIVGAYFRYMVDIAVLFGAERERATKELRNSLDFEMALANVRGKHFILFIMSNNVRYFTCMYVLNDEW